VSFQTQINANPAPAVEGDFASANPMASMLALAGSLRAGTAGVTVGRFAFAKNSDGTVSNQHPGVASRLGFVQRDQPGVLITNILGETVAGASPIGPGMPISGTGITAGTTIVAFGTGTGGLGTYTVSQAMTTEAAETVAVTLNVETNFTVDSTAGNGELAQISTNG
jgi:hypothetical protein